VRSGQKATLLAESADWATSNPKQPSETATQPWVMALLASSSWRLCE